MDAFANNLKAARKAAGLTQETAARKLGVSHGTWSKYEQAGQQPKLDKLPAIATALSTTVSKLTEGL